MFEEHPGSPSPRLRPHILPTRSAPVLILLLAAGAFLFAAPVRCAQGAPPPYGELILSIDYDCDAPLQRAHYDYLLPFKPGDRLTRTSLKLAIQALYDTGRFRRISANTQLWGDGVRIRFNLELNYYFNRFLVEGDVDLGGRLPQEVMTLPVGQRYGPEKLEEARRTAAEYMRGRGFFQAAIDVRTAFDEVDRQVDTTFQITPGVQAVFRSVEITGVPKSEEDRVRGVLSLKQGDRYRRSQVDRQLEKLKEYFLKRGYLAAEPKLTVSFDAADSTVAALVEVVGFGEVRVTVEGYDIPRDRLRRMLPVLSGEGVRPELLVEGVRNIREYLEEQGYPESDVVIEDERDASGEGIVRYGIETGPKISVADVLFRGNRTLTDAQLQAIIQVRPSRFLQKSVYSISKLDADIKAMQARYRSLGYLDVNIIPLVELEDGARKLRVTFECDEGRLYRAAAVDINGNTALETEWLRSRLVLRAGSPYSPQIAERDRLTILGAYHNEGFQQAQVSNRVVGPDENGLYQVEFDVEEGARSFVDEVLLLGNTQTANFVIARKIQLQPDEPLSVSKMLETEQELYELGVFDLVRVAPQNPESAAGYQNIVVRVNESPQYVVHYGFGYQEREKLRGLFEIRNLNFLGTARRLDLRLRASAVEQAVVLSLQQAKASILPVNSYLSLSYLHEEEVSFDTQRFNFSYQYSRPLSGHSWAIGRLGFRNVRLSNLQTSPSVLGREDQPRNLATVSAIYVNDTRDNFFDAEKGFFTSTDLNVTTRWLGSNNYVTLFTQNSYHRRLLPFLNLSLGMRIGWLKPYGADSEVPISERFFAGGPTSLRGFETDRAGPLDPVTRQPTGGSALVVVNAEFSAPLYRMLRVAGFYDGGNVFRNFGALRASEFSHTVGIGLRIRTPIGPLRFDYAFNLNLTDDRRSLGYPSRLFFFTIGNPF